MTALPEYAKLSNFIDSLKDFFKGIIGNTNDIYVSFDRDLKPPTSNSRALNKWIMVKPITGEYKTFADTSIEVFCCTREDSEGYQNNRLVDIVVENLIDTAQTDSLKRIPLYQSTTIRSNWTQIGSMLVTNIFKGNPDTLPDGTKVQALTIILRFAMGI